MSEQEKKDGLMDCLFSRHDMKLVNVKFFRGTRDSIGEDEIREQAHSAFMQKRLGSVIGSTDAPKSKQPKIDVRAFVANL